MERSCVKVKAATSHGIYQCSVCFVGIYDKPHYPAILIHIISNCFCNTVVYVHESGRSCRLRKWFPLSVFLFQIFHLMIFSMFINIETHDSHSQTGVREIVFYQFGMAVRSKYYMDRWALTTVAMGKQPVRRVARQR